MVFVSDVLVVFDDASRLRWRRLHHGLWRLDGTWPDKSEKEALDAHLSQGGCLLVITDGQDIVTNAWPHELTALPTTAEPDPGFDDPIEVHFEHFDWLPSDLRLRGDQFVARERTRWGRESAIHRPPLILDVEIGFDDPAQVIFAITPANLSRTWVEREVVHYLKRSRIFPKIVRLQ